MSDQLLRSQENPLAGVPDGWVTDRYSFEEEEWCVAYSSDADRKKLYIENSLVKESDSDSFSFLRNGMPVYVTRHLRAGFYELEIARAGVSVLTGAPVSSQVRGIKSKLMVIGYLLFAFYVFSKIAERLGS